MTVRLRLLAAAATLGAPLAWVAQLVLAYAFEDAGCAPGDGTAVWGAGVRTLHASIGRRALAVAIGSLLAAVALREGDAGGGLGRTTVGFLRSFAILGSLLFTLTIALTAIGSTVLATCHSA